MKKCSKCNTTKEISLFYDGKSWCIDCSHKARKEYAKTKTGLVFGIYSHQKQSSKKRGHLMPTYSKEELYIWAINQDPFSKLYSEWKKSGYDKQLSPSIDRIDDGAGYSFDNIKMMTFKDNRERHKNKKLMGDVSYDIKSVVQYSIDGVELASYKSLSIAHRITGAQIGNISNCISGKRKSAGGFIWKEGTSNGL